MHSYQHIHRFHYIDDFHSLSEVCQQFSTCSVLAIDTEFVRTKTLRPILGLIQIFDGTDVYLIDPIAIEDLSELATILNTPTIIKVAHSCSEDLEAIWHHLNVVPTPIFDTQFAASLLGEGNSIGYANLVEKLFSITLDKGESRTDWTQRPLSDAQLKYAAADVTHLMAIYEALNQQVSAVNKLDIVFDEIKQLSVKKTSELPSQFAYLNLKNIWRLKPKQLATIQKLAEYRVDVARQNNISLNFVIKEQALFDIAVQMPTNTAQLFQIKSLFAKQAREHGTTIIDICAECSTLSIEQCPNKLQRLIEFAGYKGTLQSLKELIEECANKNDIPPAVLASKKQMNQMLKWLWFDNDDLALQGLKPDLLLGFRYDLLKDYLTDFISKMAQQHEIKRSI